MTNEDCLEDFPPVCPHCEGTPGDEWNPCLCLYDDWTDIDLSAVLEETE